MVRGVERWVHWLNPVIKGEWNLGRSEDKVQVQSPRQDKWISSDSRMFVWVKINEASKFTLVPLKNSHLWSSKRLYEIRGGAGNLHIIIHRRSQKLSIAWPTPYKQSAESSRQFRVQCGVCRVLDRHFLAVWDKHFFGINEPQSPEERQTFWAVRQKRWTLRNNFVNRADPIRTKRWK